MIPIIKPFLGEEEALAAADAIRSGWIAQGPKVAEFEAAFCAATGAAHAIAVSNCTTGLHLALIGADIGPGDDVLVPSLSFIASTNCVPYVGANPVFADVDPVTQNVTAESLAAVWTPNTRAVIAVHQVGMPVDLGPIAALCAARGAVLIEDAACAIGSTERGASIGNHSDFVVFSFHPRKVVTTGEGGMITVRDAAIAQRLRTLRQHAMSMSDVARHQAAGFAFETYDEVGYNYRMTDIQAAVGLIQLARLPALVARRRELAARYNAALADLPDLQLPVDPPHGTTNYQTYVVKLLAGGRARRDALLVRLTAAGIGVKRGIMAAHLEPAWADHPHVPLPETERWTHESFGLPLYHTMTDAEHAEVVTQLRAALADA